MSQNNFSNFTPDGTPVVQLQEWTKFFLVLNQKLNQLFNSVFVTSVTASLPLVSSGGTTPNITINNATSTTGGIVANMLGIPNVVLCGKTLGAGTSVTATIATGVCTVAHTTHGYNQGDVIVLTGTTTTGTFAGLNVITGVTTNAYTFNTTCTGTVTSPVETFWFRGTRCSNPTLISNITGNNTGVYPFTFKNAQADGNYGIDGTFGSSTNQASFNITTATTPSTSGFSVSGVNSGGNQDANNYFFIALIGIV